MFTSPLSSTPLPQVDPGEFQLAFDRVISIEMFEHMKNYQKLLHKVAGLDQTMCTSPQISTWARPGGKVFVHIFTHKWKPYHFKVTRIPGQKALV